MDKAKKRKQKSGAILDMVKLFIKLVLIIEYVFLMLVVLDLESDIVSKLK